MSKYSPEQIAAMKVTLEETVSFYSEDTNRRGLSENGNCVYETDGGNCCAVGRLCSREDLEMIKLMGWNDGKSADQVYHALTSPKIKAVPVKFLETLQSLHDCGSFWNAQSGKGLSEKGLARVEDIKEEFGLN